MNLGVLITVLKLFEESGLTSQTPPAISEELKKKKFFHELGLKIPDK
jgi:hypothetical protein